MHAAILLGREPIIETKLPLSLPAVGVLSFPKHIQPSACVRSTSTAQWWPEGLLTEGFHEKWTKTGSGWRGGVMWEDFD